LPANRGIRPASPLRLPDYFPGKSIVHLSTIKCHIYTTTGAMKNAFGGLLNTGRRHTHSWIHEVLVDLLAIQKEIHPGIFALVDGTTAGDGPGPRTLRPGRRSLGHQHGSMCAVRSQRNSALTWAITSKASAT
jgi:hypothetical protein